ncbi:amylo-alpha-1,6-glucosidase [Thermocoleostomius sinensis]|uniref:Glycogen debranching enzyme N-terminal domain-containing protein n=1 Tax=Thermocoleostomius sinensis A174 TaxID=2016057 RepID=A0A9E8ZMB3_9CYAN|nr:amylo-alpha-1,6-glucosidase [Thermocoleostomius sinensis]WAL61106.1 glycogen debranching enzyme N-terminal domain-containing protein [Thermocoleostomius sinensis A174]
MEELDTREWLLTNGLGSFASGTVCDAHTRTYHGWLIAALEPPSQRTLLLSRIDASLEVRGRSFELSTNFWTSGAIAPMGYRLLQQFHPDPVPTWSWGWNDWQLQRRLIMPHGLLAPEVEGAPPQFYHSILVEYRYDGSEAALLQLRPMIGDRIFHYQQHADSELQFVQLVEPHCILLQAKSPAWMGTPWQLSWSQGKYSSDGMWYWGYRYTEETKRGLSDREDLFTPGVLSVLLQPGETVILEARVGHSDSSPDLLSAEIFERAIQTEQQRLNTAFEAVVSADNTQQSAPESASLQQRLLRSGDQFIVYRASINSPTVIAGYPWFNDWGRDTLIALPGLALVTQRYGLAKGLLQTFGMYCQQGLIPNAFPDAGTQPFYNSIDAALWWIETLGLYLEATQDWEFLVEQYPIVWRIYKGLMAGTWYNIRVDAFDGLVTWDAPNVALTWMDAVIKEEPVTPRRGKAVEINALWYSALCWAEQWATRLQQDDRMDGAALTNQARRFSYQTEQVKSSLQKFWNPALGYFYDAISPDDYPDDSIRPNAVIALSLSYCGFPEQIGQRVLHVARDRLLTPYGLRALDPSDARYVGKYEGGIWQRDRAYHQGTVWSWLIGPFIRAWQRFYPNAPVPIDWEPLFTHFDEQACFHSISEMFDGDPPHAPRGAIAQAWSVAEVIRHSSITRN